MRKLLLIAALLLPLRQARAQDASAPAPTSLATVSGTAVDSSVLTPDQWLKIGGAFGSRSQWQFGLDKSATVGSCAFYAVRARFLMAGPCRDLLLLAKDSRPVFHLGGAALYSASHTPGYLGRIGFNVGPAASSLLDWTAGRIPYIESAADWKAPSALAYLGKVTTFDYSAGTVGGVFDHGPQVKVDVPLDDLKAVLGL